MTNKEIIATYGISPACASISKRRGWFIANYGRNQVIIDRDHFHPESAYGIANQVFWRKFKRNPVALSIREDMVQQAVAIMFMQSGKVKAGATEKYNSHYGFWWCAYNAMLAYLNTWIRQARYDVELQDEMHPMMYQVNRGWSPDHGWSYC